MEKIDIIASLLIGEASALLMLIIGRNITLPAIVGLFLPWLPVVFPLFTFAVVLAGFRLRTWSVVLYQLSKFSLVGGVNFLIDLGVLSLLIFYSGIAAGFYAAVFKAVAFMVAVISSFLWNKFWTFRSFSAENAGKQFAEFFIVSGVGLAINVGTFAFINDFIGTINGIDAQTWATASAAGAAAVGLIWNFLGYKFIVFRNHAA